MKTRSLRPWIFGGLALLLLFVCVGLFLWAIRQFGWEWTGFTAYTPSSQLYQRGKTLWDWLQLLIVPAMLAAGAAFFTWWSSRTERQIAQLQYEQDQQIADQRYKQDQQIANQRYQQDQELTLEKQREDLLQSYLDRMADLLLDKGLRDSQPDNEVRKVARTRTISTLIQLDSRRARTIFVFLSEAQLREEPDPILSFAGADLSSAKWSKGNLTAFNLSQANLRGTDFSEVDLSEANLRGADLSEAQLRGADLRGADLSEAQLRGADLKGANLSRTNLRGADLSGTDLKGARLKGANLKGANLSEADLSAAYFRSADLSGAALGGAKLNGTDLSDANLSTAYLSGVDLSGVDLSGANLSGANLREAELRETNLRGARLRGTRLNSSDLSKSNLKKADLSGANLFRANLDGVLFLESARLDKTILCEVRGLTPEQFADCKAHGAIVDEEATPAALPSEGAPIVVVQKTPSQALPPSDHAVTSTHIQAIAPEVVSPQGQTVVKPEETPPTPASPSQESTPPTAPLQGNTTTPSSSQDAAS